MEGPNVEYPLEELWKHLPYDQVSYGVDPQSFKDEYYVKEQAKRLVQKALEPTVNRIADKLLDEIVKVAGTMDSEQRKETLLRLTVGVPQELPKWVKDMLYMEVQKVRKNLCCFTDVEVVED